MKIRQRRNGNWCMEHNGVEAPYEVIKRTDDKFDVFDVDDDETPIASLESAEVCERLALAHYNAQ